MTHRLEILALLTKIEALAALTQPLNDPVLDMLIATAQGELAHLLAGVVD